ncbi:conserved protein, unknown function [Hepatocystis sp. ex Piliocolobus tephrosceles]|nr:conserved protein, unknown function [Hepatocystis sp. ex Piliocolobus tephrosceles]
MKLNIFFFFFSILLFYKFVIKCYSLTSLVSQAHTFYIGSRINLKKNNINYFILKKKQLSRTKLNQTNDENYNKDTHFFNNSINKNIFRNKYNCLPGLDEVKEQIEQFKKKNSFYFTEHSILELIKIENNIIVLNIEGKFYEDINVVFAQVTKHLLETYVSILGVLPYNINTLNLKNFDNT